LTYGPFLQNRENSRVTSNKMMYETTVSQHLIHYNFLIFFWVLASGPLQWPVGPLSAKFRPHLAQTSSYATG